ncbi:MAG: hypothetical protein E6J85_16340 [Deltaproteobacteria bacterium]|nr:MAG: hypothetical protein E6J85_16340 [Deltaproteobacteria bacterium]
MDPYMNKTASLLREGKGKLDRLSIVLRSPTPEETALARRRRLQKAQAHYADVRRHFEALRAGATEGIAELKIALEKAWDSFQSEVGGKA